MKLFFSSLMLVALGFTSTVFAETRQDFCGNALDSQGNLNYSWFQQTRGMDPTYQIDFANDGGIFNGGVCWWHSEWTRNAIYQTVIAPELPKPSAGEAAQMIKTIMNSKSVVVIGGYNTLAQFSQEWQPLLQKALNERQLRTAIDFGWIRGLKGHTSENADTLATSMDSLNEQVNTEHKIVYQMLQLPGVDAHAWLVIGMQATANGYTLDVSDSNYPGQITTFNYVRGDDTEGLLYSQDKFIAYTQQDNKFSIYENNIRNFCKSAQN